MDSNRQKHIRVLLWVALGGCALAEWLLLQSALDSRYPSPIDGFEPSRWPEHGPWLSMGLVGLLMAGLIVGLIRCRDYRP